MKPGDLVKVMFGPHEKPVLGVFIRDDIVAIGRDAEGYPVITRAYVLWDGQIYSTAIDQMEGLNESR